MSQVDICLGFLLKKIWESTKKISGWVLQNVGELTKSGYIKERLFILEFELHFGCSPLVTQEFWVHTTKIYVSLAFRLFYSVFVSLA